MKDILKSTWKEFIFSLLFFWMGCLVGQSNVEGSLGTGLMMLASFHLIGLTIKSIRLWRKKYGSTNENPNHLAAQNEGLPQDLTERPVS
jgi:hypothetical protein